MRSKLDIQISELRGIATTAATHPFLPATARVAIFQLFQVIEIMGSEIAALRESLRLRAV